MALPDILQAMDAAARDEGARLLAAAQADADALRAAARSDAQATQAGLRSEAERSAAAARARINAEAQLRIAAQRAAARERFRDDIFAAATAWLDGVRTADDYPRALRALLTEALSQFAADEPLLVNLDSQDLPLVAGNHTPNLRIEGSLHTRGGVVVEGSAGRVVADNTLERRLERARDDLRVELADTKQEVQRAGVIGAPAETLRGGALARTGP